MVGAARPSMLRARTLHFLQRIILLLVAWLANNNQKAIVVLVDGCINAVHQPRHCPLWFCQGRREIKRFFGTAVRVYNTGVSQISSLQNAGMCIPWKISKKSSSIQRSSMSSSWSLSRIPSRISSVVYFRLLWEQDVAEVTAQVTENELEHKGLVSLWLWLWTRLGFQPRLYMPFLYMDSLWVTFLVDFFIESQYKTYWN